MKFFIMLAITVWFGWRLQQALSKARNSMNHVGPERHQPKVVETLVQCERCGVHLPQRQARALGSERFACATSCLPKDSD